jgi:choline dehydrogenase
MVRLADKGEWDFIVVGAGSAGAVVAARLAGDPARRVLLLEAGGSDRTPLVAIPGLVEQAITSRRLNWHFEGEPDPSLRGRRLTWAAGRVLGGSSSINGMVYGRGLPADYAAWAVDNPGWGWADMLPAFIAQESWQGPPHPSRGREGPLLVRRFEETEAACAATMDAFVADGLPYVEDYCTGISHGIGRTQATQRRGFRHSAADAYLRPARGRGNLTVATGCRVDRLIVEAGRCRGVEVMRRGARLALYAGVEVILAAGAIGTPKLLLLSGIGAPEDLRALGIAVVHALPGVGRNLTDHVNIRLSAFVGTPTYNTARRGWRAVRHGARLLAQGSGPASSPANHCQAFIPTDPASGIADVQVQLMAFGFGTPAEMRQDGITAVVSPCRPRARGTVGLRSADPAAPPSIRIAMLDDEADVGALLRGAKLTARMLREGAQRRYGGRLYAPDSGELDDAGWRAFFAETAALNWHPAGTCRMGPAAESGAVVDATLRVHGLAGLSIADASIMPSLTSANTNAPVIAIAARAAGFIAARAA